MRIREASCGAPTRGYKSDQEKNRTLKNQECGTRGEVQVDTGNSYGNEEKLMQSTAKTVWREGGALTRMRALGVTCGEICQALPNKLDLR